MQRRHASILIIFLLLIACGTRPAAAEDRSTFRVSVFDCFIRIPTSFVLNAHERKAIVLYLREGVEGTRVYISSYEDDFGRGLAFISAREIGGIKLEEYRFESETPEGPVFRLHDGTEQVAMYGATTAFADALLKDCSASREPSK